MPLAAKARTLGTTQQSTAEFAFESEGRVVGQPTQTACQRKAPVTFANSLTVLTPV